MKKILLFISIILMFGFVNKDYDFGLLKADSAEETAINFNKFLGNKGKLEFEPIDYHNQILDTYELNDDNSTIFNVVANADGTLHQVSIDDITSDYLIRILEEINFPKTDALMKSIEQERKSIFTEYKGLGLVILKNIHSWSDSDKPISQLLLLTDEERFGGIAELVDKENEQAGIQ